MMMMMMMKSDGDRDDDHNDMGCTEKSTEMNIIIIMIIMSTIFCNDRILL